MVASKPKWLILAARGQKQPSGFYQGERVAMECYTNTCRHVDTCSYCQTYVDRLTENLETAIETLRDRLIEAVDCLADVTALFDEDPVVPQFHAASREDRRHTGLVVTLARRFLRQERELVSRED